VSVELESNRDEPRAAAKPAATPFLVYVALFHLSWTLWPWLLYPKLTATLGEDTFAYAVVQLIIRCSVWIAPVWLYLRYVDRVDPIDYLKLKRRVGRGLVYALVLTAVNLVGMVARFGAPHPTMARVTWNSIIGTSFLVGVIEEIPYRGFMLPKFAERLNFWTANLMTSLLFVAIHLPGWMALHTLRAGTAVTIFIFGFVMGAAFKWSGSLWAPIVTHSANDFLSYVIFQV
jgi:membrane protease YdiL (CAAX protease family)